ncbi:MAG TPA: hypothetical protein VHW69_03400, partial [Rhizomicrobium sp.]|nr:hypothetical protein [Rhizomicrobium sp.]
MNANAIFSRPDRRAFLRLGAGLLGASAVSTVPALALAAGSEAWVTIENFSPDGKSLGLTRVHKVVKSETEWKHQLSANSFEITRHEGTE